MPPAARITDGHLCPAHGGGPVITGALSVLIGYKPAARVGDTLTCVGPPDKILAGEPTVLIAKKPAARIGDPTVHLGRVAMGCPTVIIGSSTQANTLRTNEPFCQECERKKKEREARRRKGKGT